MEKLSNLQRVFVTIRYLRLIQIYHQIKLRIVGRKYITINKSDENHIKVVGLKSLKPWINKPKTLIDGEFKFLNIPQKFENSHVEWDYACNGKLWTYNLNYFDYLSQPSITLEEGKGLILNFVKQFSYKSVGMEPYPTSLRGINWIKFIHLNSIRYNEIDLNLYKQYKFLANNFEYHLLGNHLLENAFSLLFGSFYFRNPKWFAKSKNTILTELQEQILRDGGHFELSPMYHCIVLDRLLDSINLVQENHFFDDQNELLDVMEINASSMLGWLNIISCGKTSYPNFNDSIKEIAPTENQLLSYGLKLGINANKCRLSDSGYRRFDNGRSTLIADVGDIGARYIPGHAHADSLNFIYNYDNKRILVDPGISTYENGKLRTYQRSTSAHNTVSIANLNSSDTWGSFRVAKRAETKIHYDNARLLAASHNGYKKLGVTHKRVWNINNNKLIITDELIGNKIVGICHLHFDHKIDPILQGNTVTIEGITIKIKGFLKIVLEDYKQAIGFNKIETARKIEIEFQEKITTVIKVNSKDENFISY